MFDHEVRTSFIAQGHAIAAQINHAAAEGYEGACRNWAANGGTGEAPAAPFAVEPVFNFDGLWTLQLASRDRRVSSRTPQSFLPAFGTDAGAIGGPVGGPIPNQPGRFYAASNHTPYVGQIYRQGGTTYEYKAITPFNRAWEVVA